MDKNSIIKDFPVTVYGNMQKYSDTLTKQRCRLFYRGKNRNGSFITDEFAEKLIKTIPYAPVKGIYDISEDDYTDHGAARSLGRIYGVVPVDYNFAWEKHMDDDGVEREYACVDVLVYTGLYTEAEKISGKAQSMELYSPSVKGSWQTIDGMQYFVFEEGSFLGLQVLGQDVEPCFEGAAFFSLCEKLNQLEDESTFTASQDNRQGGKVMQINFRMSDNQKFNAIWQQLNQHFNDEGGWMIDYDICDVYDEYALVKHYESGNFERVYYTKDEENDIVTLGEHEICYIVDVNESEREVLNFLRKKNCSSFEAVSAQFEEFDAQNSQISEFNAKIEELNNQISTLNSEKAEAETSNEQNKTKVFELEGQISELNTQLEALIAYKKNVEEANKLAVIENYAAQLPSNVLDEYKAQLDKYSAEELDMHLTYALKKVNPDAFNTSTPAYTPKDNPISGIASILSRYENK